MTINLSDPLFTELPMNRDFSFQEIREQEITEMSQTKLLSYYVFLKNIPITMLPREEYSECLLAILKLRVDLTAVPTALPSFSAKNLTDEQTQTLNFQRKFYLLLCPEAVRTLQLREDVAIRQKILPKNLSALRVFTTRSRKISVLAKQSNTAAMKIYKALTKQVEKAKAPPKKRAKKKVTEEPTAVQQRLF